MFCLLPNVFPEEHFECYKQIEYYIYIIVFHSILIFGKKFSCKIFML